MIMHDLFGMFKCEANKQAAYCSVHETVAAADTCRIADIALGKHPQARAADELRAGEFLLAIAGVRPGDADKLRLSGTWARQVAWIGYTPICFATPSQSAT